MKPRSNSNEMPSDGIRGEVLRGSCLSFCRSIEINKRSDVLGHGYGQGLRLAHCVIFHSNIHRDGHERDAA